MKKSLITLLVATLPAAAFADVTIYGKIKAGVENVDNGNVNQTNIDDLGSRIGFKGSEDLGNGLKTIWQVETGFNVDGQKGSGSSSGTLANRESFVGIGSQYGTFRLGNLSTFGDSDMGTVNPWESKSDSLQLNAFTRDDSRVKNAVRIDSQSMYGFKAAFLYGTKEDKRDYTGIAAGSNTYDRELYNLGLGYENSGFFGKYNYIHETPVAYATGKTHANDKHRIEAGYNANNLLVSFGYRNDKGDVTVTPQNYLFNNNNVNATPAYDGNEYKSQEYALTAAYTMGAFTPKATYAQSNNLEKNGESIDGSKYKQWIVGVDYALSKRTTLGAQYGEIKGGNFNVVDNDKLKGFGLNLVHSF